MTTTNKRQQEIIRKREYWNKEVEGQGPDMHNQPKDKHQNSIIRKAPTKHPYQSPTSRQRIKPCIQGSISMQITKHKFTPTRGKHATTLQDILQAGREQSSNDPFCRYSQND